MGMRCEEVWRDLSEYIDGDLNQDQRVLFEDHVVACRHCTAVLDGTHNLIRLYRDERILSVPEGLHDRLITTIRGTR
jgi:predicted anti-sigma-YlaC factor YlaD